MTQNLVSNNLAAELLTKHRDRLEKHKVELERDKKEFLTELLRVEAELRNIDNSIDLCSKEINRVTIGIYTFTGSSTTGLFNIGSTCLKQ